ncbi:hypothetical protein [Oenococcus sicerae]|uniref:DUF7671 family protein n=1 Tax=Oenococcus sicerae TaxID=2203724 RepID=UPI0010B02E80|nr:hypothetical protein OAL24_00829 [Oenococcus sicerae]
MKKNTYKVQLFYGVPLQQNSDGKFVYCGQQTKLAVWRTGKHTRGHFDGIGQLFLTENHLTIVILKFEDLRFNQRHQFVSLSRFLDKKIDNSELNRLNQLFMRI